MLEENDNSMLSDGENHPAVYEAFAYIKRVISDIKNYTLLVESFASSALEGNRCANICLGTLTRITKGMPVGERYVFGLAWMLKDMEEHSKE